MDEIFVLVDSEGKQILRGKHHNVLRLYQCLTGDEYEVTEADELQYGDLLRVEWKGDLNIVKADETD